MLYIGRPVGAGAGGRPTFGLRVEQIRLRGNTDSPFAIGDSVQHRELMNWQVESRSEVRVQLARAVTWDVSRGVFGPRMGVSEPRLAAAPATSVRTTTRSWQPRAFASSAGNAGLVLDTDSYRESSVTARIAATAVAGWSRSNPGMARGMAAGAAPRMGSGMAPGMAKVAFAGKAPRSVF